MNETFAFVKKVYGENKIKPIRLNRLQAIAWSNVAKENGMTLEQFINKIVTHVAKKRRWAWYKASRGEE